MDREGSMDRTARLPRHDAGWTIVRALVVSGFVVILLTGCGGGLTDRIKAAMAGDGEAAGAEAAERAQPNVRPADTTSIATLEGRSEAVILRLFEQGRFDEAEERLLARRSVQPADTVAARYLPLLEPGLRERLGAPIRSVTVQPGDSLSVIAARELGDAREFVALARYNDVMVPRTLPAGRVLAIPAPQALAALRSGSSAARSMAHSSAGSPRTASPLPAEESRDAASAAVVALAVSGPPTSASAASAASGSGVTAAASSLDDLHAQAVLAFRNQDLDAAISLWDRVLSVEPNHEGARAYRARAVALRDRVERLPAQ